MVISIIGFLSSIVLASLNTTRSKARYAQRISDIKQLQNALELYRNSHDSYPSSASGSQGWWDGCTTPAFGEKLNMLVNEGFIPKIPTDPTNKGSCPNYEYTSGTIGSSWQCNYKSVSSYAYVIRFQTENTLKNFSLFNIGGRSNDYCVFVNK